MAYDANGNMITENSDTFTYDAENRLVSRTNGGATTTYTYDGQGNLVKKSSSSGSWTVYVGDIYEKHEDGSYVTYYWALGRRIASRSHTGPGDPGAVLYYLADHLGSSTQILDSGGTLLESVKYYPYGSVRAGGMTGTDKKFTGQQEEGTAFGLYDYGARFYGTKLGRFLSADPLVVSPGDPQMLDRYAYVRNNPLNYIDPSGLSMVIVCGTNQNCEGKGADLGTIDSYFWYAMAYWVGHEGLSAAAALGDWVALRSLAASGYSPKTQLAATGVAFLSTAENGTAVFGKIIANAIPGLGGAAGAIAGDPLGDYAENLHGLVMSAPGDDPVDTLVGFSLGGYGVAKYLAEHDPQSVRGAILIEPGFNAPAGLLTSPIGSASQLPGISLVTLNGTHPYFSFRGVLINAGGTILGANNQTATNCAEHCNHANTGNTAEDMMNVNMAMSALW